MAKFLRTAFLYAYRSSRFQMFFKIGLLKSFANFTGKHLCWSLFLKKNLQAQGLQLYQKKASAQLLSCEVYEIFKNIFLYKTLPVTPLRWLLLYFFKKSNYKAISQPCYDVQIIFSSRYIVWCIKGRTRLFINLSSIVSFSPSGFTL